MNSDQHNYQAGVDCLDRIVARLKPETSTKMKSVIVGLYSADSITNIRYSQQIALLHLDYDRHIKTYFFRVYHLQSLIILMQIELYYGFMCRYKLVQTSGMAQNLYLFDLFEDGIIGFQFRNSQQAQLFNSKLRQIAPTMDVYRQMEKKKIEEALKKKKETSFFSVLKKKIFKESVPVHEEETKVIKVTKAKSIHFSPDGNIITENLPPEWLEVFSVCGVRKEDLKNPQIAQMIVQETILHEAKKAALKDGTIFERVGIKSIEELDYVEEDEQGEKEEQYKTEQDAHQEQSTIESIKQQQLAKQPQTELVQTHKPLNQTQSPPIDFLPVPPPPPFDFLPPPPPLDPLTNPILNRISKNPANIRISMRRENLMQQIRNNKIKLKPVQAGPSGIHLDISEMNREQRKDLGEQLRLKLQRRKPNFKARNSSSSQDDN